MFQQPEPPLNLKASPPPVIATLKAGAGASGVSFNKQGTLALVANRNEGTVSVFTVSGKTLTPAGTVKLGDDKSGPSHAMFTPDGKSALVTRDGDNTISLLSVDGSKVASANRDFAAGLRPYGLDISSDGRIELARARDERQRLVGRDGNAHRRADDAGRHVQLGATFAASRPGRSR